jgi:hypothetical protein
VRADVIEPTIDQLAHGADLGGADLLTFDVRYDWASDVCA